MNFTDFSQKHKDEISSFVEMSHIAGARADYVQGGGGNTSVKMDDLMAIKASGFRFNQIEKDDGYAVLNYKNVLGFYNDTDPSTLDDVDKAGSAKAAENVIFIEGFKQLRPSVEVGFHSLLGKYVLHTHSIYANFFTCSDCGPVLVEHALEGLGKAWCMVPYTNPGAVLTFDINRILADKEAETGKRPSIIFLMNHGVVVTGDTAEETIRLHDEVNERLAAAFGVKISDFAEPKIKPCPCGNGTLVSDTPWLWDRLKGGAFDAERLEINALYPDQLVFLTDSVEYRIKDDGTPCEKPCTIFSETGRVRYNTTEAKALTIEQTLVALALIYETVEKAGYNIVPMSAAGKDFISNWESEKYRKSLGN